MSSPHRSRAAAAILAAAAGVALTTGILTGCAAVEPLPAADQPIRDDDGQVIERNESTDVFALQVGDCLDDAAAVEQVQTVPTVPCSGPHDSEVYAALVLDGSTYPGVDAVLEEAEAGCRPAFERFVGVAYLESIYDFSFYYPTEASWATGDREVLCVVYDPSGQVTGSLQGVEG